jgi:(2Fe-2S) ferredoxin
MFSESKYRVHVCFGPNCTPRGSKATYAAFQQALLDLGIYLDVELIATSCRNRCELGPSVNVYPGPVLYGFVDDEAARRIAVDHLKGGTPVASKIVSPPANKKAGR